MIDILGDLQEELHDLVRRIRLLESASPLGWSSVTEGALEIRSAEGLIVVGTARIDGTQSVDGRLEGSGTFDWTGPLALRGNTGITGSLNVTGVTTLNNDVTLNNDLTLGSGRILAGPVRIDRAGSYGGRVYSTSILVLEAGNAVLINNDTDIRGILVTDGLDVDGPKNFRISHPTKPGYWLRHGSTESPVSGIEYWGEEVLDEDGQLLIELPEYFEELAKPDGRTVLVTGRGFEADWSDIADGKFTVTGKPGGRFSWLVKAERHYADFLLEEEIPADQTDDGRVGPWAV